MLTSIAVIVCMTVSSQYTLKLELTTDDYPGETSWSIFNGSDEILSGGPYADANTLIEDQIDVAEGDYEFSIADEFGDGICCGFGDGSYVLSELTSGFVISSGGEFGEGETISFSLPYTPPIMGCTDPEAINYNPDAEQDDGTCEYLVSQLEVTLTEVSDDFDDVVDISHAGDSRLFIVEQGGTIRIMNDDYTSNATPFLNINSLTNGGGEQGLLGLAFHPDYANNGFFYVNYTNNSGDTRIARYTVSAGDPDVADPSSAVIVLSQSQPYGNHNAGDLAFGPDGYLYIPLGDGGSGGDPQNRSQNPATMLGKMLRIDVDSGDSYGIPADNPFVDVTSTLDEIWAIGLRNTWRISFDAETGDLWMGDVGQNVWEEIDFEPADSPGGVNYGWRCTEGLVDFNQTLCDGALVIEDPVAVYNHSGGACSVTGGYIYRGAEFPGMVGKYFYTDYCNGQFAYLEDDGFGNWEINEFLGPQGFGWSTFGENNQQDIFVGNLNGTIYKLEDVCSGFEMEVTVAGNTLTATPADSYIWLLNGEVIDGATASTYTYMEGGTYTVIGNNGNGCSVESEGITITGLGELAITPFTISPNPTADVLMVTFNEDFTAEAINIYDMKGSRLMTISKLSRNNRLDVTELSNGVYVIEVIGENTSVKSRFLIQQ
ncbi:MAG: glucose/arabinose dehydrogenase [Urechidicola sp.]|jgi:glucose/arabinose dehydrogenase